MTQAINAYRHVAATDEFRVAEKDTENAQLRAKIAELEARLNEGK